MPPLHRTVTAAIANFQRRFGVDPTHYALAPGRVNLIGEHTDYQEGFVMPCAIDRYVAVAARKAPEDSEIYTGQNPNPARFIAGNPKFATLSNWQKYVAGVALAVGPGRTDLQAVIESDLPMGAGLSSSAAIEMAFGTLWREIERLTIPDKRLILACQKAENESVGVRCGVMDQTASLLGKAGHALQIDTRQFDHPIYVPLPREVVLIVCDTGVKHSLAASEYNVRRQEVESAARKLGVQTLRDATFARVETETSLTEEERNRARHIVSENGRVASFAAALRNRDRDRIQHFMQASHQSLRTQFEVSCPELDVMADLANHHPHCWGARMTGGGFGGACIALVSNFAADEFIHQVGTAYDRATGKVSQLRRVQAVDGAFATAL